MFRSLTALLAASAALVLVPGAGATTHNVQVGGAVPNAFLFTPANITIAPGDTVHWGWAGNQHSVTSGDADSCTPDGAFDTGLQNTGFTFDKTFMAGGTTEYFCSLHCAGAMVGTVTVSGQPTAARMTGFSASWNARGVSLRWRTASEIATLGFDVYRQEKAERVRVNERLIRAGGTAAGRAYAFVDRTATRRGARYYLQVVSTAGGRSWHGPAGAR